VQPPPPPVYSCSALLPATADFAPRLLSQVPANEGERAEQLEVASQCLCDAFEIDLDAAAPEFSLAEIYRAGVESLVRPPLLCFAAAFR